MSIDLAAVTAIDTHVHIEADAHGCFALDDELIAASAKYFSADTDRTPTLDQVAGYYRSRNMAAVVFTVDAHTAIGHKALSSREIIEDAAQHADVLIPFASVDPHDGAAAVDSLRDLVAAGARGLKLHPSLQGFSPNDPAFSPALRRCGRSGRADRLPHRANRDRRWAAGRARHQTPVLRPDAARRRGG